MRDDDHTEPRSRSSYTTFACPFTRAHRLPLSLYQRGVGTFGERGLMEITAISGFYTLISMTLNAFEVEVAPGVEPPFKREP